MKKSWGLALLLVIGGLVIFLAGGFMLHTARREARLPQGMGQIEKALAQVGGEEGLRSRLEALTAVKSDLVAEESARRTSVLLLSQRIDEVFTELGLVIAAASDWQAAPEPRADKGAVFERIFHGSGSLADLLSALHTFESWPDRLRVRALEVAPQTPGTITFTLELAALRLPRAAEVGS